MCGIAGMWNLNGKPIRREELIQFTNQLAHRGPDGWDVHVDESANLGLGHRRLAIIDLNASAAQPMSYADERYWIVFNGEIYNFIELRKELEALGYAFKTESDTEALLAAYDQWGEDFQFKLNGMWALAIWDSRERKLFLARDRFGVKPLIYFFDGKRFAFASEMKAFLALDGFRAEYDPTVLANSLADATHVEGAEDCLFQGPKRLLGGHCLTLNADGEMKIRRWWHTLDHLPNVPQTYEEQVAQYRELFLDACRIRMRSDVPIGTALSGGLDSSSVLSSMSHIRKSGDATTRMAREWQKAFVGTWRGEIIDERRYADEVIRKTGVTPIYCEMNAEMYLEHFDEILYQFEELSDIHLGPWYVHKMQRQHGVVVTIDGHGGDEALGGYTWHVFAAMRDANPLRRAELALIRNSMSLTHGLETYVNALKKRLTKKTSAPSSTSWLISRPKPFSTPAMEEDAPRLAERDELFKALYADFHFTHLPTVLRNFDRLSMAHGVEVRSPMMDWRLVAFSFALPSSHKIGGGYTKRILRDAMKGILPESIRKRTKKLGFPNLDEGWNSPRGREFIRDAVASDDFMSAPFWDGKRIKRDLENALNVNDKATIHAAWRFAQAQALLDKFQEKNKTVCASPM
ncbi:MAG: asparagine synthase (glutamine-hydrolyzing) [Anaerolineales bacterium]|nr:asparagine synthase (glutamine-hydrolyzing) [Anaerolineales bacterium]